MPELPEMENYRRLLSQHLINVPITGVTVNREKTINIEAEAFQRPCLAHASCLWSGGPSIFCSICMTVAGCCCT